MQSLRRGFLRRVAGISAVAGAAQGRAAAQSSAADPTALPRYARAQNYKSLKQSSFDTTGGNSDRWPIAPGATQELFRANGPGIVTHIWFTIAAQSPNHLKEIVIRAYWEGNSKPSVEVPVGDLFGLNLGQYVIYQSAFLNCSSIKALNCYFAMPFRRSALITATNEGKQPVGSFYSNIDYQLVTSLPDDIVYFHAQYRQKTPNTAVKFAAGEKELNTDGKNNYVFAEARGRGHLMGITMGVLQNGDNWFGEGDDMIFIDDEAKPAIIGTGTEDYINGAWDFGGRDGAIPFAHLYNGAQFIQSAEHGGGRYLVYRWHGDNPVTFQRYLKHTIEHGHADDRGDNFYSVCYWYQSEPYTDFPPLPAAADRIPVLKG
ncbi:MAG TPA: glycoside hydrolase family 172 protein [Bryobacteraceae bacterium]|nr:glycoside hydrolase family 172 protein [Bryobacteraceae bacterium]